MECIVCCEKCIDNHYLCNEILESKEKCGFHACTNCYKKYLLESSKEPHCMSCRIIMPFEKQLSCFSKEWLFGKYKIHREVQLMHIEQQRFTQDLIKIENKKKIQNLIDEKQKIDKIYQNKIIMNNKNKILEINSINVKINDLEKKLEPIYEEIRNLQKNKNDIHKLFLNKTHEIQNEQRLKVIPINDQINKERDLQKKKKRVSFDYNYQCPDKECNGILNNDFICVLCDKKTCKKCYIINENEETHECDPEQIKTFKKIKEEAKPCPSCGEFISKISGCDQMFCVTCGTSFSWKTGAVEKGVIHNPHAHQYFQNNPEARELYLNGVNGINNNGACRAHIPQFFILNDNLPIDLVPIFRTMYRKVGEFRAYFRNIYNQIIENDPLQDGSLNEDLRLRKLNKSISEKHFKSQLHARIKKYNFKKQVYPHIRSTFDIVELFFWEIASVQGSNEEKTTFVRNIYQSILELINETNVNIDNITRNFGYSANIKLTNLMSGYPLR